MAYVDPIRLIASRQAIHALFLAKQFVSYVPRVVCELL